MSSFAIWGSSRSDLARLAWSIAEAIDPGFLWVEMSDGGAPPSSRELEVLEEITLDRIDRMDRGDLLASALGATAHPHDGPAPPRLPHRLQGLIDRPRPEGRAHAIVLANLDRTLALARDSSGFLQSLVGGAAAAQVGLVATFGTDSPTHLDPFECQVSVRPGPSGNIWNPTVDWSVRSPSTSTAIDPPPIGASSHEAVRHLRSQRGTRR